ncbi:unnamed protein product [Gongylonema pulchrum]|uniref:Uncharacterized protein n=1 Tax=Gongylonema pulchrum TaxID=637853 RepID=A0A183D1M7_9BILA|nr:unnamed protein product [Gongylonema pulchrum]
MDIAKPELRTAQSDFNSAMVSDDAPEASLPGAHEADARASPAIPPGPFTTSFFSYEESRLENISFHSFDRLSPNISMPPLSVLSMFFFNQ